MDDLRLREELGPAERIAVMYGMADARSAPASTFLRGDVTLGCARITDSFESWVREAVFAFDAGVDLYEKAAAEVGDAWGRGRRARRGTWWEFWR